MPEGLNAFVQLIGTFIAGLLCIYIGWRIAKKGIEQYRNTGSTSKDQIHFKLKNFEIKAKSWGPVVLATSVAWVVMGYFILPTEFVIEGTTETHSMKEEGIDTTLNSIKKQIDTQYTQNINKDDTLNRVDSVPQHPHLIGLDQLIAFDTIYKDHMDSPASEYLKRSELAFTPSLLGDSVLGIISVADPDLSNEFYITFLSDNDGDTIYSASYPLKGWLAMDISFNNSLGITNSIANYTQFRIDSKTALRTITSIETLKNDFENTINKENPRTDYPFQSGGWEMFFFFWKNALHVSYRYRFDSNQINIDKLTI